MVSLKQPWLKLTKQQANETNQLSKWLTPPCAWTISYLTCHLYQKIFTSDTWVYPEVLHWFPQIYSFHVQVYRPFWPDFRFLGVPMARIPIDFPVWSHPLNLYRQLSVTQMPSSYFLQIFLLNSSTSLFPGSLSTMPPRPYRSFIHLQWVHRHSTQLFTSGQVLVSCCDDKSMLHNQPSGTVAKDKNIYSGSQMLHLPTPLFLPLLFKRCL